MQAPNLEKEDQANCEEFFTTLSSKINYRYSNIQDFAKDKNYNIKHNINFVEANVDVSDEIDIIIDIINILKSIGIGVMIGVVFLIVFSVIRDIFKYYL